MQKKWTKGVPFTWEKCGTYTQQHRFYFGSKFGANFRQKFSTDSAI